MKEIPLTQGRVALVDDEDYSWLQKWPWIYVYCPSSRTGYAVRHEGLRTICMHRQILGARPGQDVDHVNAAGTDNQRANIRLCTRAQNNANQRHQRRATSSRYKGVYWDRARGKWHAQLKTGGVRYALGRFGDEREAARAYNAFALKTWGEFARLNDV